METKMKTEIKRTASWFRPWRVLGFELSSIALYDEEGIYHTTSSGWLEHDGKDVVKLLLKNEVVRKLKEDFKKKLNYVLKRTDEERGFRSTYYRLYIYLPRTNIIENVEVLDWEDKTSKHFKTKKVIKGLTFWTSSDSEEEVKQDLVLYTGYRKEDKKEGTEIKQLTEFLKEKKLIDKYNYDVNKVLEYIVLNKKEFVEQLGGKY